MSEPLRSHLRGWPIEMVDGVWRFVDTGEPTADSYKRRPCGFCGLSSTPEGHDGCLGTLPGIMNACCGHGRTHEAYLQFHDGSIIRSVDAVVMQNDLRNATSRPAS